MRALAQEKTQDHRVAKAPSRGRAFVEPSPLPYFAGADLAAPALFRKASCSCGGGCPACQAKSSDLKISQPNDPAEIEADQIADKVMRMPQPAGSESNSNKQGVGTNASVGDVSILPKRSSASGGVAVGGEIGRQINSSRGGGKSLDFETRNFFEPRFGHDLGNVNIHTGREAAVLSRQLSAKAFTVGDDIYFGEGIYQPGSDGSQQILAHELAHVIQQRNSGQASIQRWPSWDEVREAGYSYMIDGLRSLQREGLERLRRWSATLTPGQQTIANGIITAVEAISEILIELILAVVGLVVGFVAGIVQMIVGLFQLAVGIVQGILLFLYGFIDGGARFDDWAGGVLEAISNIPAGLRNLVNNWLADFERASTDRQIVMIGELTGQILALIATFEVAASRAGSLPRITATLPRVTIPVLEAAPELSTAGGMGGSIGMGVRVGSRVVGGTTIGLDVATPATVGAQATLGTAAMMSSISDLYGEGPETDAIQETDRRRGGMAARPQHHIFPREFRRFFEQRGFADIDDFCVELEEASHQALHGGGDWRLGRTWPNEWNQRIMRELSEAERYMGRPLTRSEIITIGRELMLEYGIDPDFVRWRGA